MSQVPNSDILGVQAGDFLAIKEDSARLQLINATASSYEYYFDVESDSAWSTRSSTGYSVMFASSDPKLNAAHAIRAHIVRPVRMKFRHTYTPQESVTYNISVSTSNNITSLVTTTSIDVQTLISNVTILTNYTTGNALKFQNLYV